jgi:hypothetical protein
MKGHLMKVNRISQSTLPHGLQSQAARKTNLGRTHNNKSGVAIGTVVAMYYGGPAAASVVSKIGAAKLQKDAQAEADSRFSGFDVVEAGAKVVPVNAPLSAPLNKKAAPLIGIGIAALAAKLLIFS